MARSRMSVGVRAMLTVIVSVCLVIVGLFIGVVIVLWPVFNGNVATPKKHSLSNMKQTALAHAMYVEAHDGFGPAPDAWMDQLGPYLKAEMLFCVPFDSRKEGEFGYAYYRPLGGVRVSDVKNPEEVVLAFESSDLSWNANGGLDLLPKTPYQDDGTIVFSFLDTHVKACKEAPKFEIKLP